MKISLNFKLKQGPYGGGNQFGLALTSYLNEKGVNVVRNLRHADIDIILFLGSQGAIVNYRYPTIARYLLLCNPHALVVQRVNECDERKGTTKINPILRRANRLADYTVFVSSWLRDLHVGQGMKPNHPHVIHNGSDTEIFNPKDHQPWDGDGPLKIVTHHWSDNWMKGFDIYQRLDEMLESPDFRMKYSFTYIGNLPPDFTFKHATYIPPTNGTDLANKLREHHAYITASRNEPGSNHQNEGALCGLPLMYIDSGSMGEYCQGYGVEFTVDNLEQKLSEMRATYPEWVNHMADFPFNARRMCMVYDALFEEMLHNREELLSQRRKDVNLLQFVIR